jgi:hypothetical protein
MARTVKSDSEKLDNVTIETSRGQEYTVGEIKHSTRIVKSATPKYELSWYVKWTASVFILASMSIRGVEGLQMYDLLLSLVGVAGWMWVGFLWKDRALILLNGVGIILFLNTLIRDYFIL